MQVSPERPEGPEWPECVLAGSTDAGRCERCEHCELVSMQADLFNDKTMQQMGRMVRDKELGAMRKVRCGLYGWCGGVNSMKVMCFMQQMGRMVRDKELGAMRKVRTECGNCGGVNRVDVYTRK